MPVPSLYPLNICRMSFVLLWWWVCVHVIRFEIVVYFIRQSPWVIWADFPRVSWCGMIVLVSPQCTVRLLLPPSQHLPPPPLPNLPPPFQIGKWISHCSFHLLLYCNLTVDIHGLVKEAVMIQWISALITVRLSPHDLIQSLCDEPALTSHCYIAIIMAHLGSHKDQFFSLVEG